jgi:hypothetical protein
MLGPWGQRLLDFYLANSLWINGLILLYFAVLFASRWNYRKAQAAILAGLQARYPATTGKKAARDIRARLDQDGAPWEEGLRATAWPFIAGPRGLLPRLKNARALQQLFPLDALATLYAEQTTPAAARKQGQ